MIISFAVTNFRSIRERAEVSLLKTSLTGHPENVFKAGKGLNLLKSAVVYGPNASGKSNLLMGLVALQFLVGKSSSFKTDQKIGPYETFKLDEKTKGQPVTLELCFLTNGIRYDFLVSFLGDRIVNEELRFYPKRGSAVLYHRQENKEIIFGEKYRGAKKNIEKLLQPNQLFFSKAAENNPDSLKDPFIYINENLNVFPFLEFFEENKLEQLYIRRLAEDNDSSFARRFNKLICALDTGIRGIMAKERDWSKAQFAEQLDAETIHRLKEDFKYNVRTIHPLFNDNKAVGEVEFSLTDESKGTRSLFILSGIILEVLEKGAVLVMDEFESSLHPEITRYLIRLFHNRITNPKNAQLVFATHDVSQLSGDTFRRDQVWFTEKDEFGGTKLKRLANVKGVRLNVPLDKWYSAGKLGATPMINDVDFLIEMQDDESVL